MRRLIAVAVMLAATSFAADKDKVLAGEPLTQSRTVSYHASEIVKVNSEIHFATIIVFASQERIVAGICGDEDHWQLDHVANVITIKPEDSARGAKTNLNVIMESGNIYSLVVHEISNEPGAQADLKLVINPGEEKLMDALKTKMFVSADALNEYKKQAEDAEAQLAKLKTQDKAKIAEAQNSAPQHIRHDYKFDAKKADRLFGIKALYTLNGFTYIEANPQEAPALYEVKDGKPSLIEVHFNDGLYVAPKVIDQGYLKIGKQKVDFKLEKDS